MRKVPCCVTGPGYEPCAKLPGAICLKELSFRSSDVRHAQKVASCLSYSKASRHGQSQQSQSLSNIVVDNRGQYPRASRVFA